LFLQNPGEHQLPTGVGVGDVVVGGGEVGDGGGDVVELDGLGDGVGPPACAVPKKRAADKTAITTPASAE
jgi:hypothetical protein